MMDLILGGNHTTMRTIDDPPGKPQDENNRPQQNYRPHPFEVALVRKLESKTNSMHDAFLLLDIDRDGQISRSDMRTVLHNEFGLDMTEEQERDIFVRRRNLASGSGNSEEGIRFREFAKYFTEVSNAVLPSSQLGTAAAVGFYSQVATPPRKKRNETNYRRLDSDEIDHQMPIQVPIKMRRLQLRRQIRQILSAHSTREGSGMKGTSLFLAMDVHRSGRVSMQEFIDWLASVGLVLTMDQLRLVVLGEHGAENDPEFQKNKVWTRWFGEREETSGMTEYEFALFVESLDMDCQGGGGRCRDS